MPTQKKVQRIIFGIMNHVQIRSVHAEGRLIGFEPDSSVFKYLKHRNTHRHTFTHRMEMTSLFTVQSLKYQRDLGCRAWELITAHGKSNDSLFSSTSVFVCDLGDSTDRNTIKNSGRMQIAPAKLQNPLDR